MWHDEMRGQGRGGEGKKSETEGGRVRERERVGEGGRGTRCGATERERGVTLLQSRTDHLHNQEEGIAVVMHI